MQRSISLSLLAVFIAVSAAACESTVVVRPCAEGDCGGQGEGAGGGETCGPGTQLCDGECANLQTDPDHCGSCSNDCNAGDFCVGGNCQAECPFEQCGDFCI